MRGGLSDHRFIVDHKDAKLLRVQMEGLPLLFIQPAFPLDARFSVGQLADYDPSPASDAYQLAWYGTQDAIQAMLAKLGFPELDVTGVLGALRSHRGADRRLAITPDALGSRGFKKAA